MSDTKEQVLTRELVMVNALFEAVKDALDGQEPSDFMLSFPIVQKAWSTFTLADRYSPKVVER